MKNLEALKYLKENPYIKEDIYSLEALDNIEKELEEEKSKREELEKDIKRYFDLLLCGLRYTPKENEVGYKLTAEFEKLSIKLSKVGK